MNTPGIQKKILYGNILNRLVTRFCISNTIHFNNETTVIYLINTNYIAPWNMVNYVMYKWKRQIIFVVWHQISICIVIFAWWNVCSYEKSKKKLKKVSDNKKETKNCFFFKICFLDRPKPTFRGSNEDTAQLK